MNLFENSDLFDLPAVEAQADYWTNLEFLAADNNSTDDSERTKCRGCGEPVEIGAKGDRCYACERAFTSGKVMASAKDEPLEATMSTDTTTIPFGDENYLPAARRFVFQSPLGGKFHAIPNIFGHATDSLCGVRSSGWMTLDVGFGDLADESNRCKRCIRLAQDEADQFARYEADQIKVDNGYVVEEGTTTASRKQAAGKDLSYQNLSGQDLSGADLTGADLNGADLTGADLTEAHLGNAVLRNADLGGAVLIGADLSVTNLNGANLTGANLAGAVLIGAVLYGANLSGANLSGVDFREARGNAYTVLPAGWAVGDGGSIEWVSTKTSSRKRSAKKTASASDILNDEDSLNGAGGADDEQGTPTQIQSPLTDDANDPYGFSDGLQEREGMMSTPFIFTGYNDRPTARRKHTAGQDFGGLDFNGADLSGADLSDANLRDTNLVKADLRGANLAGANLVGANLAYANLTGANLVGADLGGAWLAKTDLTDADLTGANLMGAYLKEVLGDAETILPAGYSVNDRGIVVKEGATTASGKKASIERECKYCHGVIWKEGPRYGGPALYWRDSTGWNCILSSIKGGSGNHAPVINRNPSEG